MDELARLYARSLFEVAREQGKLDLLREQLGQFADALRKHRELALFFFSPYFSTAEKQGSLAGMLEGADEILLNFLALLIENHRMPVIFRARLQYDALWDREHELLPVEVTSAVALDPGIVEELGTRIGQQTGQNVELISKVDPDILGGIVLRVGNSILDASIKNRLNQLRREVARNA